MIVGAIIVALALALALKRRARARRDRAQHIDRMFATLRAALGPPAEADEK